MRPTEFSDDRQQLVDEEAILRELDRRAHHVLPGQLAEAGVGQAPAPRTVPGTPTALGLKPSSFFVNIVFVAAAGPSRGSR